jgi:hypothetical protein
MIERIINAGHKYTNQYEQSDPNHQVPTPVERAGIGAGGQGMRSCANPYNAEVPLPEEKFPHDPILPGLPLANGGAPLLPEDCGSFKVSPCL